MPTRLQSRSLLAAPSCLRQLPRLDPCENRHASKMAPFRCSGHASMETGAHLLNAIYKHTQADQLGLAQNPQQELQANGLHEHPSCAYHYHHVALHSLQGQRRKRSVMCPMETLMRLQC